MRKSLANCLLICFLFMPPALGAGSAGYDNGMKFESEDGRHTVNSGARVQIRFTHEDPDQGDGKGSFDIRRAKWWLKGKIYEHWKYKLQVVFSADETQGVEVGQGPPVEVDVDHPAFAELEDAIFQYTKHNMAQPWLGQGKVAFGRQGLTSSGKLQFVDRLLGRIEPSRSQGVGLNGQSKNKRWEYNLGLFDDFSGQNIRSNKDEHYMTTARVVFTPLGEYKLDETPFDYPETTKVAVGVKGLRDTTEDDTGIETDREIYAFEFALKLLGFSVVSEYFAQTLDTQGLPKSDLDAGYVQLGWLFPNKKIGIAGRYAVRSPDVAGPSEDVTETGVALSWYFSKHNYKIQADVRDIQDDGDPANDTKETRVQAQFIF